MVVNVSNTEEIYGEKKCHMTQGVRRVRSLHKCNAQLEHWRGLAKKVTPEELKSLGKFGASPLGRVSMHLVLCVSILVLMWVL